MAIYFQEEANHLRCSKCGSKELKINDIYLCTQEKTELKKELIRQEILCSKCNTLIKNIKKDKIT